MTLRESINFNNQIITKMKRKIIVFLSILAISSFVMSSCSRNEKKDIAESTQDAQDTVEKKADNVASDMKDGLKETSNDIKQERMAMSAKIEEKRQNIKEDIDKMDAKMEKATANEKARWKVRKAKMQSKVDDLDDSIDELKSDTKRNWKEFKSDLNRKIDNIQEDIK